MLEGFDDYATRKGFDGPQRRPFYHCNNMLPFQTEVTVGMERILHGPTALSFLPPMINRPPLFPNILVVDGGNKRALWTSG